MKELGRYKILEKAYEGGSSLIYKAWDEENKRQVAIKMLKPGLQSDRSALKDFLNECEILKTIEHQNIVKVYEIGKTPHMIMEWIEGRNLKNIIVRERIDLSRYFFPLAWKIGDAINYLHNRGIIHNDIKPENILVSLEGEVKLIDFALAMRKGLFRWRKKIKGTPVYVAPEVLLKGKTSEKSDIFSYGVLLYELLTGRLPYNAESPKLLLTKKAESKLRILPPSYHNPSVSPFLDRLVLSLIDFSPSSRPTIREVLLELGREALSEVGKKIEWREA
ncbi:MAG TPA: serine/threonine protein kinase [bacterium]|nr:serine/threonine protein kinase [bacterium]HEX68180.1 serine/threonine protein kinase [bacterium]